MGALALWSKESLEEFGESFNGNKWELCHC